MATISDLLTRHALGKEQEAQGAQVWYALILPPAPASAVNPLHVSIPDLSPDVKFVCDPGHWNAHGGSLPAVGSEALVIVDNRQQLWVVSWQ